MSEDLPDGWTELQLASVASLVTGSTPSTKSAHFYDGGTVPFVKPGDLGTSRPITAAESLVTLEGAAEGRLLPPGSSLVCCIGSIGKQGFLGCEAIANQQINAAIPGPAVLPRYLFHALSTLNRWLDEHSSETTIRIINKGRFSEAPIRLAPLPEQHRIVDKVEALLEQVNRAKERLDRVPLILKRFRQAVLAAACSGELTREWRSGQPASSGAKRCSHSIELPQSWSCDIMSSATDYMGGFAFPSGAFSKQPTNHQVIRIGNVRPRGLDLNAAPVFINNEDALQAERFRLDAGDVLVSMTGTRFKRDYGHPAQVTRGLPQLYLNQRVARLRPRSNCTSQYLTLWMETDLFRDFFFSGETGNVNQGNVGADAVRLGPIHLPPVEEQVEVARQVDLLIALISVVERRLTVASAHAQRLPQAILSKAFSGELVPTEAELARLEGRTYETAEELLKRVTALGSDAASAGKGRGRRARKAE